MQTDISLYAKHVKTFEHEDIYIFFGTEVIGTNNTDNLIAHKAAYPHIQIKRDGDKNPVQAILFKPIISSEDIFFSVSGRDIIISNLFKHNLLHIPKEKRKISNQSIVEHFLFGAPSAQNSYCKNIHRTGHGETVTIDLKNGNIKTKQEVFFQKDEHKANPKDYVRRVDSALEDELQKLRYIQYACILFSGNIESAVLATYLSDMSLINNQITSREFKPKIVHTNQSASLLGRKVSSTYLEEPRYFEMLEKTVDRVGQPAYQTEDVLIFNGLNETPYQTYINGNSADALFGTLLGRVAVNRNRFQHKSIRGIAALASPFLNAKYKYVIADLNTKFAALDRAVADPTGYAFNFSLKCNKTLAENIFGADFVRSRLNARYEYIRKLGFEPFKSHGFFGHIETAHILDLFHDGQNNAWGQLAKSCNKIMFSPFTTDTLLNVSNSIPMKQRYFEEERVKYLLKDLLKRKAGHYPVDRKKARGEVPIQKYFMRTLFQSDLQAYAFPDFLSMDKLKKGGAQCPQFLWHAISYIIWENRMLRLNYPDRLQHRPDFTWSHGIDRETP